MKKILDVQIIKSVDTGPDTSYLGEYTDDCSDWAIDRTEGEYVANLGEDYEPKRSGREYSYFKPYAGGEKEGTEDYQKYGMQDYERMESYNNQNWCFLGISARAHVLLNGSNVIQTITSGGLWGVESDSGYQYLDEVAQEQLSELKSELTSIGFTTKQIDAAFKNVEEKEVF